MIVYKIEYVGEQGDLEIVYYDELEWLMAWMQSELESLEPGMGFETTITVEQMTEAEFDALAESE